jgi:hypothetical protein
MKTCEHCTGCRNNFYNGRNPYDIKRCWSLDSAKLVTRFRLSSSCPMNIREAYVKVRVPDCYHESGYVHMKEIPDYAQTRAQRDAEKVREAARQPISTP